jgi:cold shock CspA family protein/ribosome-associated translation inhibitor RaiA
MQRKPIITWRNVQRSEAVEAIIRKRIEAVERFCPDAIGLRVTLDAPQKPRHAARGFDVRLHLEVPGPDLDVARTVRHGHAAEDITRAVNSTFTALEKRIKETRRVVAGQEVKHHPVILHGEIVELEPELGYGFVRADDGQEVYFQKDGLVTGNWDDLELGARLRFREQDGEKGPFAVDVALAP